MIFNTISLERAGSASISRTFCQLHWPLKAWNYEADKCIALASLDTPKY